jgi:hypothetical protein
MPYLAGRQVERRESSVESRTDEKLSAGRILRVRESGFRIHRAEFEKRAKL